MADDDDLALGKRVERPHLSVARLRADKEDKKAETVAKRIREVDRQVVADMTARVEKELGGALEVVRPNREKTQRRVRKVAEEILEEQGGYRSDLTRFLANRRQEAVEAMPNLTSGKADPAESDVRAWIRDAPDAKTRTDRLNTVIRSGNVHQLRAVLRESVPAGASGFLSEEHRQQKLEEALKSLDRENFETARSLGEELERISQDAKKVERFRHRLENTAMAAFDQAVKSS